MDAIYHIVGLVVVWAIIAVNAAAILGIAYIYTVGFVRSVRLILWLDLHARKDPAVGMTRREKFRGVFLKWHEMAVFRSSKDSIVLESGETFRG